LYYWAVNVGGRNSDSTKFSQYPEPDVWHKWKCHGMFEPNYNGFEAYCVTTDTEITLDANDAGCCDSPFIIEYKKWWTECGEPEEWTVYEGEKITFDEECEHILKVRVYDCLYNGWENIDIEYFYVDEQPPVITKTVGEPSFTDDNQTWWITTTTEINITAEDLGCCISDDLLIRYKIWWMDEWSDWILYEGNFTFDKGCTHYLLINASDCLGNYALDNETFIVHGPAGDFAPIVSIEYPEEGDVITSDYVRVLLNVSDDITPPENLEVYLRIPGGRRNAPNLYYPVYHDSGNEFYADVDIYKYQDGAQITLECFALDEVGNVGIALPVTFTVDSTNEWDQWMQKGWNLLQLPYNVGCNESVERILESIEGDYDYVFYYDMISDTWFSYSPDREPQYNDLLTMEGGKQYWVHMTNEDGLRYYLGLPEIEIEYPADGAVIEISDIADFIGGNTWDSQGGIDKVEIQLYFKDESNNKWYWNGTDWVDEPINLGCLLGTSTYVQPWDFPIALVSWIPGQTYYVKAMAFDAFGCYATDMASFEFISYTISGTAFLDSELTVETGSTLIIGVGNYSSWASFPYVDVVGLTNFTDPLFPLDYSFEVFNGSYFVIGGLINQTSTEEAYAVGAYDNVTWDSFIPTELIVSGSNIEDADLTLMKMEEETEPV
jgi:hypothetical protein